MSDSSKIVHVITGTHTGGAEMVLYQLMKSIDPDGVDVLSMMAPGPIGTLIEQLGIDVHTLSMNEGRRPTFANVLALRRTVRDLNPLVTQGWMYHGNLAALLGARSQRRSSAVIWGIHHTITKIENEKRMTRAIVKMSAKLSRLPRAIVYCSRQSAKDHEALGFAPDKTVIIPNGVDCELFKPDQDARSRLRKQLDIPEKRRIVGFVARVHPMKDHRNLVRAMKLLVEEERDVHLVFIGSGGEEEDKSLQKFIVESGISEHISFMGLRDDVPDLIGGFDIFCLPSAWGEAFPMVVCEAMASGVPCVVTDVGDASWIVGETGIVVKPRDSVALSSALGSLLALSEVELKGRGLDARSRIMREFPLSKMVASYEGLKDEILNASFCSFAA